MIFALFWNFRDYMRASGFIKKFLPSTDHAVI